jgi:hypothetical protein
MIFFDFLLFSVIVASVSTCKIITDMAHIEDQNSV